VAELVPSPSRRRATIDDVASAAGVSRATVSRVVNGLPSVGPAIAAKVRTAIDGLGYEPSTIARSLSLGVTRTIAVVVPDLANPTFQQMLHGVNRAAARDGYRVLVADSGESPAEELALIIEARKRTDAVVICAPRADPADLAALLERVQPAVVINREGAIDAASVLVDYASGIACLVDYLAGLGHRRLLHLDGPSGSSSQGARDRGLTAAQRRWPDVTIERRACGSSMDAGYAAFDVVMRSGATAVLAFNDLVALGLLGRAREERVLVPGRLHVVGFDDIQAARFASPPLTTMHVPLTDVGGAAWGALYDQLNNRSRSDPIVFAPSLVVRDSATAP